MLFNKKSDRTNFLRAHQFQSSQLADEEVTLPDIDKERGDETSNNKMLIVLNPYTN